MDDSYIGKNELELLLLVLGHREGIGYTGLKNIIDTRFRNPKNITAEVDGEVVHDYKSYETLAMFNPSNIPKYMKKLVKKGFITKKKEEYKDKKKRICHRIVYQPKDINTLLEFFLYTRGIVFQERQLLNHINIKERNDYLSAYKHNKEVCSLFFENNISSLLFYAKKYSKLFHMFLKDPHAYFFFISMTDGFTREQLPDFLDLDKLKPRKIEKIFWDFEQYIGWYKCNRVSAEDDE